MLSSFLFIAQVPRIVRMHSNEMEEVDGVGSGEIVAMFGVDCNSGIFFFFSESHSVDFGDSSCVDSFVIFFCSLYSF